MFDNVTPQNNSQSNPPQPATQPTAPLNRPTAPAPKVEDIYAGSDKTVLGSLNKNVPRPAVLQPKPLTSAPQIPVVGWEEEGVGSLAKKIYLFFGLLFGLVVILALGYLVFTKFLKTSENPLVENNLASSSLPVANTSAVAEIPIATSSAKEDVTADTDGDGLTDVEEKVLGINSNLSDTDSDGLSDRDEAKIYLTDPLKPDTDGDGISDGTEVKNGYDPKGSGRLSSSSQATTTNPLGLNPSSQPLKTVDTDKDGLTDEEEKRLGTDSLNSDTDKDGLSDYDEAKVYKTNPLNPDTDGDGYLDGVEVAHGFNPLGAGNLVK